MASVPPTGPHAIAGMRVRYDAERDAWLVHRPARTWPVPLPAGSLNVPPPPPGSDRDAGSLWTTMVPMLGSLGVIGFAFVVRSLVYVIVAGVMVAAIVGGTVGAKVAAGRRDRRRRERLRREFVQRLDTARASAWSAAVKQRDALLGLYPDTAGLLHAVLMQKALWERRPCDADFGSVRLGLGAVPALVPIRATMNSDVQGGGADADLSRLYDDALKQTAAIRDVPVVVPLRALSSVAVVGDPQAARDLAGSWLLTCAANSPPTDLRVVGVIGSGATAQWEWVKWLPHTRDPLTGDGFGRAVRAFGTNAARFEESLRTLVESRLDQQRRAGEEAGWRASRGGPSVAAEHVLVIIDGYDPATMPTLAGTLDVLLTRGSELAVTVIVLTDDPAAVPSHYSARVDLLADGTCRYREAGDAGRIETDVVPDRLDRVAAERLARLLAPLRLADADAAADLVDVVRLVELLGYESAEQVQPEADWLTAADLWPDPADVPAAESIESIESEPAEVADIAGIASSRSRRPEELLSTPIGVRSDGAPLVLNLREAAAGGMGPHGVLVGATGSGKSELLRSLVAGLAAGHDPDLLSLLLVDFKGGATFADLERLPHTAGLITNLADDLSLVDRMRASLAGELDRRQQFLRDAGKVESIRGYHELRSADPQLPQLPYLVVIVDEFGELLAARPEFLEVFVAIGRLGRSLGVHLLLATQRLEEGRIRGLESHLRYRMCLRTYSAAESSAVIGVPDAHTLPPMPGLGYLRVDGDLVRFKAATTSLPHRPVQRRQLVPAIVHPFKLDRSLSERNDQPDSAFDGPDERSTMTSGRPITELRVLLDQLATAPRASGRRHQVWLPPLPTSLPVRELLAASASAGATRGRRPTGLLVGLIDDPEHQARHPLVLGSGAAAAHVACVGSPRTGKTTFLRAVVESLSLHAGPADTAAYILDLGGGSLHDLEELPHVGAVAGRHDPEAVGRLIREMRAIVDERAAAFRALHVTSLSALRAHPRAAEILPDPLAAEIFLLVDNIGVLRHEFTELDLSLADLASTSLQFGIRIVATANRWLDVRPALLEAIGQRIELRLNDPVDSLVGRALAATVPAEAPGRGVLRDGRQVQLAMPDDEPRPVCGPADIQAPRILPLPKRVSVGQVPALAAAAGRDVTAQAGLLLGVGEFRLQPEYLDMTSPGRHLLVWGDDGAGRTTLLRRIVRYLAAASDPGDPPRDVRLHVVDLSRGLLGEADLPPVEHYAFTASLAQTLAGELASDLLERLPPPDLTRQQLMDRSWWHGPEHVLIVDDYDLMVSGGSGPLTMLADALGHAADIGLHVVLARRVAGASRSAFEPFGQRLRELTTTALIMDGDRSEGPLIAEYAASRQPPGRALLIRRGRSAELVQLALDGDETAVHSQVGAYTGSDGASAFAGGEPRWQ